MRRREAIGAIGALVAVGGCQGRAATTGDVNTADGTADGGRRTVLVDGSGEVDGDPDLALLSATVAATAEDARTVRTELAEGGEALRTALSEAGIDDDRVRTVDYRIDERIDRREMEEDGVRPGDDAASEYVYYRGRHAFEVEVTDVDAVGEVVDVVVEAGVDGVDRVTYTLSEERRAALREAALTAALSDARSEAETIADEIGGRVVEATVVDASEARVSPVRRELAVATEAATATPGPDGARTAIEPGSVSVRAEVRVEYAVA